MNLDQPIVAVGAVGALISGIGAAVALALRSRSRERLAAIEGASEEDKVRLVADAVAMFDIPVNGLSKKQRYDLVVAQLHDRDRQRKRVFILAIVLMVLLAGTTLALAALGPSGGRATASEGDTIIQTTGDNSVNSVGSGNTIVTSP